MSARKDVQQYERLVEADPTNVQLLQKLGEACQRAGDNIRAADAFARVGECYERDGFFLKAVALLKQVLKLDPERNDINFKLADLHLKLGLSSEAVAYFHIGLHEAHRNRDHATCLATSRKLIEVEPHKPQFRLYFAHLLLWAERKEDARAELVDAARLLRADHPDLAATAEAIELKPGKGSTSSELEAVRTLRLELNRRINVEQALLLLDFAQPN